MQDLKLENYDDVSLSEHIDSDDEFLVDSPADSGIIMEMCAKWR